MIIQIALGIFYANLIEWIAHKYVLHGLGKKKGSFWSFHWSDHHRTSRKKDMKDASYLLNPFTEPRLKEVIGILGLCIFQLSTIWIFPYFTITTWVYAAAYLYLHRKVHVDTEWGKRWMPWHFRHHCGKDQDSNWGVVLPLFDYILGTRK
jgi:sterol desaturase/sphingolipid hydroxylase (fatty acid hydroxylase superfamily)